MAPAGLVGLEDSLPDGLFGALGSLVPPAPNLVAHILGLLHRTMASEEAMVAGS